ncbi:MAG TPA: YggT family protein [Chloroflexia bacterium]|nr:YggT family protein [Chloroflexia bacterium]
MYQIADLVSKLLNLLILLILIRSILSWFMPVGRDAATRLLVDVTEPLLAPIRGFTARLMPGMPIDFSPWIAIIALQFLAGIIAQVGRGY